jgi:thioredoxin reductase (NADPH)
MATAPTQNLVDGVLNHHLEPLIDNAEPEEHKYDYDLIVVGGGSGGLAASKEAAKLGKKVACLDFVKPSPIGTSWGLGGTCVNVGCIPKKLFHTASIIGESIHHDAKAYGWEVPDKVPFNWETLSNNVQDYIGSLNFGYRTELRDKHVEYLNEYGVFVDPHTLECTNRKGEKHKLTARRFIIAVGGRPKYPDIPGDKEHGITSDDLFSLLEAPNKTLVVGASYVALECAGFLNGLGYDATVMARSIFLRGYDQQCAEQIADYMAGHGVKFIRPAVPTRVEKLDSGKKKVYFKRDGAAAEESEEFDTVMFAVGRNAETTKIGLEKAGVILDKTSGKVPAVNERTNVPHIYAIGDVLKDRLELTPVAIQAGRLLARRLYGGSKLLMDYRNVPTTVFTPLEYGACGFSEEDAVKHYGEANIEVYHSFYKPLEWTIPKREDNKCYVKIVCHTGDSHRVLGFHVLGPNAGEITQGWALGLKMRATKADFESVVGIHPTTSEEFTTLRITKRSGENAMKKGC